VQRTLFTNLRHLNPRPYGIRRSGSQLRTNGSPLALKKV
jgi:hypothetical protein